MIVDNDESLWIGLPMGRHICLPRFKVTHEDSPFGTREVLSYQRGNWTPAKGVDIWPRSNTWGGSLVESCCQGIARDILCDAMLKLQDLDIVMHVHDEIVIECDEADAKTVSDRMVSVMTTAPPWAWGLPLACLFEINERFGK